MSLEVSYRELILIVGNRKLDTMEVSKYCIVIDKKEDIIAGNEKGETPRVKMTTGR